MSQNENPLPSLEDKKPTLLEHASPLDDERSDSRHGFNIDETVIARFGKRQQLRVSALRECRKWSTDNIL